MCRLENTMPGIASTPAPAPSSSGSLISAMDGYKAEMEAAALEQAANAADTARETTAAKDMANAKSVQGALP